MQDCLLSPLCSVPRMPTGVAGPGWPFLSLCVQETKPFQQPSLNKHKLACKNTALKTQWWLQPQRNNSEEPASATELCPHTSKPEISARNTRACPVREGQGAKPGSAHKGWTLTVATCHSSNTKAVVPKPEAGQERRQHRNRGPVCWPLPGSAQPSEKMDRGLTLAQSTWPLASS